MNNLADILLFQSGYNTALVLTGTAILGMAAGFAGTFLVLRRQALASDAVSHATLPGIALGFLVAYALGLNDGRHLPTLLAGAALTGLAGILFLQWIVKNTKLPEDAATGTVLGIFYALGIALLSAIQIMGGGSRAGLDTFLLGQTAAMSFDEVILLSVVALIVISISLALLKELGLACFDPSYADVCGFKLRKLDMIIMAMMLAIVCIGLKVVGLVLIVALLIIPPVAAQFWCQRLLPALLLSGMIGALSCYIGAALSALLPDIPTGATIVLCAFAFFMMSFMFGTRKGLVRHLVGRSTHA